jgi:sulfoxide reductase heme-binding subunit YedZ
VSALAAIVPFTAHWRPLAVGLGTVALDLVAALIVTSMLRRHLSLLLWRSVHLLAFVSWPVAIWHTIGAGSDWSTGWARAIVIACVAAVVAAVLRRLPRPGRLAKHLAAPGRS